MMETATKIILAIIVASIFAIGIAEAFGEPFEADIPFNYTKSGGYLSINTEDHKRFDMYAEWRSNNSTIGNEIVPPSQDGCNPGFDIDITTGQCRPVDDIIAEAKAEYKAQIEEEADDTVIFEGKVIDQNPQSPTDIKLVEEINKMLETDAHCYQGQELSQTAGVQNENSFPIPTMEVPVVDINGDVIGKKIVLDLRPTLTNEDLKGFLGLLVELPKAECRAQGLLDDPHGNILSPADQMFAFCDSRAKTSLGGAWTLAVCGIDIVDHRVMAHDVPIVSQARVNQEANADDTVDHSNVLTPEICRLYSHQSQEALGCEIDETVGLSEDGSCREGTMKTDDGKRCAPIQTTEATEMTDHGAELEAKLEAFKEDGGAKMFDELYKEKLAEDIARLSKQLREMKNQQ